MKILVLSDSHGNLLNMVQAVERETPHAIYHLGDCWRDAEALHDRFPHIPLEQVPGNCDYRSWEPAQRLLMPAGKRVLICHGHTLGVKQSLLAAGYTAEEQAADVLLFGHTHRPLVDWRGRTLFLNPGSIGDYRSPTYGLLTIENEKVDGCIVPLN